jgi:hypothetical protein
MIALGVGACGGGDGAAAEDQSIVVIHVNFDATAVELHQIKVSAHLGDAGLDNTLLFPVMPRPEPIQPGATLALLIPITRTGMLDLIVTGLDANMTAVAKGNGQTTISVGDRVDFTISLASCASPGC